MPTLIKPAHRDTIEALAGTSPSAPVRRRATVLLLYDAGHPTNDVAQKSGLSVSSVLRWRRLYRERGMGIFPKIEALKPDVPMASVPLPAPISKAAKDPEDQPKPKKQKAAKPKAKKGKKSKPKAKPKKSKPMKSKKEQAKKDKAKAKAKKEQAKKDKAKAKKKKAAKANKKAKKKKATKGKKKK